MYKIFSKPLMGIWVSCAAMLVGCGGDGDKISAPGTLPETRCPYNVGTEMAEEVMVDGVAHLGCELSGSYTYADLIVGEGQATLRPSDEEFEGKPIVYVLSGVVELGSSETYNSEQELNDIKLAVFNFADVKVRAKEGSALIVHRNAILQTNTDTRFSSIDDNYEGQGEWGGIVVHGFARNSRCPEPAGENGNCNIEGAFGNYGGYQDTKNRPSTVIQVPRGLVAEAGGQVGGRALAALTLHSVTGEVGFQHLEIVNSGSDGIYIDGGDVKLANAAIDNSAAHAIRFTGGYRGVIQSVLVRHGSDSAAIKAESDSENFFSAPVISNLTISNPQAEIDGNSGTVFAFGGETGAFIHNSAATGFSRCIDVAGMNGNTRIVNGELRLADTFLHCDKLLLDNDESAAIGAELLQESNVIKQDPALGFYNQVTAAQFPDGTIPISGRAWDLVSETLFDTSLRYYGAVKDGEPSSIWYRLFVFNYSRQEAECSGVGTLQTPIKVEGKDISVCKLANAINQSVTLKSEVNNEEVVWLLDGTVKFGAVDTKMNEMVDVNATMEAGHTLSIRAGVKLLATQNAALIIGRGSQLQVQGTQAKPVVFSSADDNYDGVGEWGGVVVNGFALNNQCGEDEAVLCNAGNNTTGFHGGYLDEDSSGSISYLRILEAGGQGIAALTLNSVGSGTDIQYLDISGSESTALELRGGAANFKNLLLTDNQKENLRWSLGYQGTLQHGFIQLPEEGGGSILLGANGEGSDDHDAQPRSKPAIVNFTFIGNGNEDVTALRFQKGSGGYLYNTLVTGFGHCLNVDDQSTYDLINADPAMLYFGNVVLDCNQTLAQDSELNDTDYGQGLLVSDRVFEVAVELDSNYMPSGDMPQLDGPLIDLALLSERQQQFIDSTHNYFGALSDIEDRWYLVWTDTLGSLLSDECDQMGTLTDKVIALKKENPINARVCALKGTIVADRRLVPEIEGIPVVWLLSGNVRVGVGGKLLRDQSNADKVAENPVSLYIEPGTFIMAANANSALHVTRGGQLIAEGDENNKIYFLGWKEDLKDFYDLADEFIPSRLTADKFSSWQGVTIDGFARNNLCLDAAIAPTGICNVGGPVEGHYGGYNNEDNSGVIEHVSFYNAEKLWFRSVGRGTKLSHILFEKELKEPGGNLADELKIPLVFFSGGVVSASHLFIGQSFHNMLQWNHGYQGTLQHLNLAHFGDYSYENAEVNQPAILGLNSDEDKDENAGLEPRSMPTLINMSLSAGSWSGGDLSPPAIRLSQGSGLFLHNSIVGRSDSFETLSRCLEVNGQPSADLATAGGIVFHQVALDCESSFGSKDADLDRQVSGALSEQPNDTLRLTEVGMQMEYNGTEQYLPGYLKTLSSVKSEGVKVLDISASQTVDVQAIDMDVDYIGNEKYQ